jgi:hypothetical protein
MPMLAPGQRADSRKAVPKIPRRVSGKATKRRAPRLDESSAADADRSIRCRACRFDNQLTVGPDGGLILPNPDPLVDAVHAPEVLLRQS